MEKPRFLYFLLGLALIAGGIYLGNYVQIYLATNIKILSSNLTEVYRNAHNMRSASTIMIIVGSIIGIKNLWEMF